MTRASAWRWVAALAALVLAWVAVPGGVPLYDGLGIPDEPYRYVAPPPGYHKTPPPGNASGQSAVRAGTNADTVYVNTDEQAPQVNVVIPDRLLAVSGGAATVTVRADPVAPDPQPSKGKIDGNVYRVTVTASPAGTVRWAPPPGDLASMSRVVMRATSAASPPPVFLYRSAPALPWKVLAAGRFGNDIYSTEFAGFGDYALAFGVATAAASHVGSYLLLAVPLLVVLLAVLAVLLVRTRRRTA